MPSLCISFPRHHTLFLTSFPFYFSTLYFPIFHFLDLSFPFYIFHIFPTLPYQHLGLCNLTPTNAFTVSSPHRIRRLNIITTRSSSSTPPILLYFCTYASPVSLLYSTLRFPMGCASLGHPLSNTPKLSLAAPPTNRIPFQYIQPYLAYLRGPMPCFLFSVHFHPTLSSHLHHAFSRLTPQYMLF